MAGQRAPLSVALWAEWTADQWADPWERLTADLKAGLSETHWVASKDNLKVALRAASWGFQRAGRRVGS